MSERTPDDRNDANAAKQPERLAGEWPRTVRVIVGVHLRTGYADWAFRNDDSFFGKADPAQWTLSNHWRKLDESLRVPVYGCEQRV